MFFFFQHRRVFWIVQQKTLPVIVSGGLWLQPDSVFFHEAKDSCSTNTGEALLVCWKLPLACNSPSVYFQWDWLDARCAKNKTVQHNTSLWPFPPTSFKRHKHSSRAAERWPHSTKFERLISPKFSFFFLGRYLVPNKVKAWKAINFRPPAVNSRAISTCVFTAFCTLRHIFKGGFLHVQPPPILIFHFTPPNPKTCRARTVLALNMELLRLTL